MLLTWWQEPTWARKEAWGTRREKPGFESEAEVDLMSLKLIANRWGNMKSVVGQEKNVNNKFLCLLFDSIKRNVWALYFFWVSNWFIFCPSWPEATSKWCPSQNTRLRPENEWGPQMSPVQRKYKEWVMHQHYFTQRFFYLTNIKPHGREKNGMCCDLGCIGLFVS